MKLSDLSVRSKLIALVLFSSFLLLVACIYNVNEQSNVTLTEREAKLSAQVDVAINVINYFYSQKDTLGEEEAQKQALSALSGLRYDGNHYFWALTPKMEVLMHPTKPQINGKNASSFTDGGGKYHWQEMARIGKTSGAGFLDYQWKSPDNKLKNKISYVKMFPQWQWIVGSGLLVADIEEEFLHPSL